MCKSSSETTVLSTTESSFSTDSSEYWTSQAAVTDKSPSASVIISTQSDDELVEHSTSSSFAITASSTRHETLSSSRPTQEENSVTADSSGHISEQSPTIAAATAVTTSAAGQDVSETEIHPSFVASTTTGAAESSTDPEQYTTGAPEEFTSGTSVTSTFTDKPTTTNERERATVIVNISAPMTFTDETRTSTKNGKWASTTANSQLKVVETVSQVLDTEALETTTMREVTDINTTWPISEKSDTALRTTETVVTSRNKPNDTTLVIGDTSTADTSIIITSLITSELDAMKTAETSEVVTSENVITTAEKVKENTNMTTTEKAATRVFETQDERTILMDTEKATTTSDKSGIALGLTTRQNDITGIEKTTVNVIATTEKPDKLAEVSSSEIGATTINESELVTDLITTEKSLTTVKRSHLTDLVTASKATATVDFDNSDAATKLFTSTEVETTGEIPDKLTKKSTTSTEIAEIVSYVPSTTAAAEKAKENANMTTTEKADTTVVIDEMTGVKDTEKATTTPEKSEIALDLTTTTGQNDMTSVEITTINTITTAAKHDKLTEVTRSEIGATTIDKSELVTDLITTEKALATVKRSHLVTDLVTASKATSTVDVDSSDVAIKLTTSTEVETTDEIPDKLTKKSITSAEILSHVTSEETIPTASEKPQLITQTITSTTGDKLGVVTEMITPGKAETTVEKRHGLTEVTSTKRSTLTVEQSEGVTDLMTERKATTAVEKANQISQEKMTTTSEKQDVVTEVMDTVQTTTTGQTAQLATSTERIAELVSTEEATTSVEKPQLATGFTATTETPTSANKLDAVTDRVTSEKVTAVNIPEVATATFDMEKTSTDVMTSEQDTTTGQTAQLATSDLVTATTATTAVNEPDIMLSLTGMTTSAMGARTVHTTGKATTTFEMTDKKTNDISTTKPITSVAERSQFVSDKIFTTTQATAVETSDVGLWTEMIKATTAGDKPDELTESLNTQRATTARERREVTTDLISAEEDTTTAERPYVVSGTISGENVTANSQKIYEETGAMTTKQDTTSVDKLDLQTSVMTTGYATTTSSEILTSFIVAENTTTKAVEKPDVVTKVITAEKATTTAEQLELLTALITTASTVDKPNELTMVITSLTSIALSSESDDQTTAKTTTERFATTVGPVSEVISTVDVTTTAENLEDREKASTAVSLSDTQTVLITPGTTSVIETRSGLSTVATAENVDTTSDIPNVEIKVSVTEATTKIPPSAQIISSALTASSVVIYPSTDMTDSSTTLQIPRVSTKIQSTGISTASSATTISAGTSMTTVSSTMQSDEIPATATSTVYMYEPSEVTTSLDMTSSFDERPVTKLPTVRSSPSPNTFTEMALATEESTSSKKMHLSTEAFSAQLATTSSRLRDVLTEAMRQQSTVISTDDMTTTSAPEMTTTSERTTVSTKTFTPEVTTQSSMTTDHFFTGAKASESSKDISDVTSGFPTTAGNTATSNATSPRISTTDRTSHRTATSSSSEFSPQNSLLTTTAKRRNTTDEYLSMTVGLSDHQSDPTTFDVASNNTGDLSTSASAFSSSDTTATTSITEDNTMNTTVSSTAFTTEVTSDITSFPTRISTSEISTGTTVPLDDFYTTTKASESSNDILEESVTASSLHSTADDTAHSTTFSRLLLTDNSKHRTIKSSSGTVAEFSPEDRLATIAGEYNTTDESTTDNSKVESSSTINNFPTEATNAADSNTSESAEITYSRSTFSSDYVTEERPGMTDATVSPTMSTTTSHELSIQAQHSTPRSLSSLSKDAYTAALTPATTTVNFVNASTEYPLLDLTSDDIGKSPISQTPVSEDETPLPTTTVVNPRTEYLVENITVDKAVKVITSPASQLPVSQHLTSGAISFPAYSTSGSTALTVTTTVVPEAAGNQNTSTTGVVPVTTQSASQSATFRESSEQDETITTSQPDTVAYTGKTNTAVNSYVTHQHVSSDMYSDNQYPTSPSVSSLPEIIPNDTTTASVSASLAVHVSDGQNTDVLHTVTASSKQPVNDRTPSPETGGTTLPLRTRIMKLSTVSEHNTISSATPTTATFEDSSTSFRKTEAVVATTVDAYDHFVPTADTVSDAETTDSAYRTTTTPAAKTATVPAEFTVVLHSSTGSQDTSSSTPSSSSTQMRRNASVEAVHDTTVSQLRDRTTVNTAESTIAQDELRTTDEITSSDITLPSEVQTRLGVTMSVTGGLLSSSSFTDVNSSINATSQTSTQSAVSFLTSSIYPASSSITHSPTGLPTDFQFSVTVDPRTENFNSYRPTSSQLAHENGTSGSLSTEGNEYPLETHSLTLTQPATTGRSSQKPGDKTADVTELPLYIRLINCLRFSENMDMLFFYC